MTPTSSLPSIRRRRGLDDFCLCVTNGQGYGPNEIWHWEESSVAYDTQQSTRAIHHLIKLNEEFKQELHACTSVDGVVASEARKHLHRIYADRLFEFRLTSCLEHRRAAKAANSPTIFAVT